MSEDEVTEIIGRGDFEGITALHMAARHNSNEPLVTLLEHGVFIDVKDNKGSVDISISMK